MAEEVSALGQLVRWFGQTDVGRFRKDNQDSFLLLAVDGEGVKRLGKYGEADLKNERFRLRGERRYGRRECW